MSEQNQSKKSNDETIDLEEYAKRRETPPKGAKAYRIRVDKQQFVVDVQSMTGREILVLAGKDPTNTKLIQRLHGGETEKVGLDDEVDFTKPGVERFVTMKVNQTEGETLDRCPRRAFVFNESDTLFLNGLKLVWETIIESGTRWLIIKGFPIPAGYNVATADVALEIPVAYPDAQIDMAFFQPALALQSGRGINATQGRRSCDGKVFQQWSRHRTKEDPWRPGVDDLSTHLAAVAAWLERELGG